jgi:hypothetical protein
MIHGVGRDAQRIAKLIASRSRRSRSSSRVEEFTAA